MGSGAVRARDKRGQTDRCSGPESLWAAAIGKGEVVRVPKVLARYVRCPQCGGRIPLSKEVFREDFHCLRCEAPLHVSVWYSRFLALLSLAIAMALLRAGGASDLWSIVFFIPLGFIILTVLVRTVVFVVPPRVCVGTAFRGFTTFTTLDLKAKSKTNVG
jgi:hypothetical protein